MKVLPVVIVDTREQLSWTFDPAAWVTVRRALGSGDYSLEGHESRVAIERKSLADFVGCVVRDWRRFEKELQRLQSFDHACVAVEANLGDVLGHRYEARVHPNSVLGRAHSIWMNYKVPVFWWGARPEARFAAERFLWLAYRRLGCG